MSQLNDISLVAQVVVFKNTRAFDQLVEKYQSPIRRFFLNLTCGDSELSDDLAQDTFIKAYTNIASFRNLSSFSTWLYRIAYNVFYDYIRSRKETADLDTKEIDAINSTEQENVGQKMDVYQSLKMLKEVERTCIMLFYMEDISIDKIAGIVGVPSGTVKSHLSRGILLLLFPKLLPIRLTIQKVRQPQSLRRHSRYEPGGCYDRVNGA